MGTTLPIDPMVFRVGTTLLALAIAFFAYRVSGLWRGSEFARLPWEQSPEGWRGPAIFLGLLWLGLFALTVVAAYVGVWDMIHPALGEAGQSGLGLGALLAAMLGSPFVIWGTWLKYQTVRFQKEGHMTDRISKAVEQLGAEKTVKVRTKDVDGKEITVEETKPNIEVRIGAILSLERIAQDSTIHDKGRDHVRVMEILCAYVRENSNNRTPTDFPEPFWTPLQEEARGIELERHLERREQRFAKYYDETIAWKWARNLPTPRPDVAAALQVIGRRTRQQRRVEAAWPNQPNAYTSWPFDVTCPRLDMSEASPQPKIPEVLTLRKRVWEWKEGISRFDGYRLNLDGANLQGADLSSKKFGGSDAVFSGTSFVGARLEGARLNGVHLEGCDLHNARLIGTEIIDGFLDGSDLSSAWIEGANLRNTSLAATNLYKTHVIGSQLAGVRLSFADIRFSVLERSDIRNAELASTFLNMVNLHGVTATNIFMRCASFNRILLDRFFFLDAVSLEGAIIGSSDLRMAPWAAVHFTRAFGDGSMAGLLPTDLQWPKHWPAFALPDFGECTFESELAKWRADPTGYAPPPPP